MRFKMIFFVAAIFTLAIAPRLAAQDVVHAVEGAVTHVDSAAKTIAIKSADGTEHVFKFTGHTTIDASHAVAKGAKTGAVDTYLKGKEGTHVIVHYTGEGAQKTATGVRDFGKDGLKVGEGTVTHVDKAGRFVVVKTADGTEGTYRVARDASVDTGHGVVKGSEYTAKEGEKVTVGYSESAGRKVAHFIKKL